MMSALDKFHTILRQGETTTEEALELFDALDYPLVLFEIEKR
jgi:hypothetical protein